MKVNYQNIILIIICTFVVISEFTDLLPHVHYIFSIVSILLLIILIVRGEKTTKQLNETNQKLSSIFDSLDVAIWSHNLKTDTLLISPGIEKLYGYPLEQFYQNRDLWKNVIVSVDMDVLETREKKIQNGDSVTSIYRIVRPNGEVRWIQDRGIPIFDNNGTMVHFTSVLFDITVLKESEERYRSLVEMSPNFVGIINNYKLDYVNHTGYKLLGAEQSDQVLGKQVFSFFSPDAKKDLLQKFSTSSSGSIINLETEIYRVDGNSIQVDLSVMPIQIDGRQVYQFIGKDISERKKAEAVIQKMAYFDSLTGLANRNKLREHLAHIHKSINDSYALLFIDLDRFKIINDTRGHLFGDLVLVNIALRLEKTTGQMGSVYRHSGDEFIIVLNDNFLPSIKRVAGSLVNEFNSPCRIDNEEEYYITTSIGISRYPQDGNDAETIIKNADTAMYLAKERGKNNYQFYTSNLDELSLRKLSLETGLRKAIERNQFQLHYQPQTHLRSKEIVGIEALIRWQHPKLGMVPPSEFIPLAEETGLIIDIGKWVLRKAVKQNKAWQDSGLKRIPVAVNISVRQLQEDDFIEYVRNILEEYQLNPQFLELEITESIVQNIKDSLLVLNKLKALGIRIAIDDFGTGYSSLFYLKHLPIDIIKIDKAFVDDINQQSSKSSIIKAIIDMGRTLEYSVIAEGIETEYQSSYLVDNYCEIGQGYYFSRPEPPEKIVRFLMEK